jgi:protein associated with RNAse G/E
MIIGKQITEEFKNFFDGNNLKQNQKDESYKEQILNLMKDDIIHLDDWYNHPTKEQKKKYNNLLNQYQDW